MLVINMSSGTSMWVFLDTCVSIFLAPGLNGVRKILTRPPPLHTSPVRLGVASVLVVVVDMDPPILDMGLWWPPGIHPH